MTLPGTAAIPAVHADRLRAAEESGRRAVAMIGTTLRPSRIITAQSVENALRVLLAIGGSTNGLIHLTAIAGRAGVAVSLERLNTLSDETPILVDLKPTGRHYMSDLFAAGGIGAVMRELKPMLHLQCMTVTGETLGERLSQPAPLRRSRRHPAARRAVPEAGRARGAVRLACSQRRHHQALGGRSAAVRARRPRRGVFLPRRSRRAHRLA